jgi:hypothetical protein
MGLNPLTVGLAMMLSGAPKALGQIRVASSAWTVRRCGIVQFWFSPHPVDGFVIQGTRDSVTDGIYRLDDDEKMVRGEGADARDARVRKVLGPREVFAQRAIVMTAPHGSANVSVGQSIYLVRWSQNDVCDRLFGSKAYSLKPGSEGYIAIVPRPRYDWIRDSPTYDVAYSGELSFYSPASDLQPRSTSKEWLTAREFAQLVEYLPHEMNSLADRVRARERLLAWANDNPKLAKRYPADWRIELARADTLFTRSSQQLQTVAREINAHN